MLPENYYYSEKPKFRQVSERGFFDFITNYPCPLERDVCGISEPPSITYNDFELADRWPYSIVANTFAYSDDKDDPYYCPKENGTYNIMGNYEKVYESRTGNKTKRK